MKPDANGIGADRAYKSAEDASDAASGTYHDSVPDVPQEQRTIQSTMPQGPDPAAFTLNPEGSPGSRVKGT